MCALGTVLLGVIMSCWSWATKCTIGVAVMLLLLLIQNNLMQVAAGWKTSSHVRRVLDDLGACQRLDTEKAIMSFGGVAANWFRRKLGFEYLCRIKLDHGIQRVLTHC